MDAPPETEPLSPGPRALPPYLPLRAADLAYLRTTRGRPLPAGFLIRLPGPPPPLDAVRARVAERAPHLPALRYRVARGRPVMERVDDLDVARHVREATLPVDRDGTQAGRLMLARPLPGDRPPWEVWLLRGAGDGYTLCYRIDHTVQDGVGSAHTARALLADEPAGGPVLRPPSRPTPRGLGEALAHVASSLRPAGPRPGFAAEPTGLLGIGHADFPVARLRDIGHAFGGTVNDAFLGALARAVRTWHLERTGEVHPPMPVAVPLSVRAPGEEHAPGNRLVTARVLLPCDEESPTRALARVVAQTGRLRRTRRRDAVRVLMAGTPAAIGARIGLRLCSAGMVDAPASNVDFGPDFVHHGVRAQAAAVWAAPAAGLRCLITLTSLAGTARLTVVYDEALLTAGDLPDLWLAAVLTLERSLPQGNGPGRLGALAS